MKVGRNDPCPCGSGKKHKQCCERRQAKRAKLTDSFGRGLFYLFGPVAIILIIAVSISALRGPGASDEVRKVWSTAHNHWHLLAPDGTETEARPGVVWSDEQGGFVEAQPLTEAAREHVTSRLDQHLSDVASDDAVDPEATDPEL
jgi:hypothetical protein